MPLPQTKTKAVRYSNCGGYWRTVGGKKKGVAKVRPRCGTARRSSIQYPPRLRPALPPDAVVGMGGEINQTKFLLGYCSSVVGSGSFDC